jgi:hypothetical protein
MESPPFFSSKFKRQVTSEGSPLYIFYSCYTQDDKTHNEIPYLAVDGSEFNHTNSMNDQLNQEYINTIFTKLPEETYNPFVCKKVYETWIRDCSGAFIKAPTLTQCLANTKSFLDTNAPVASLNQSEEETEWILQWIPTKIHVAMPNFQIYWAPSYKTVNTRIPEFIIENAEKIQTNSSNLNDENHTIELQNPEKVYTIHSNTRPSMHGIQSDLLQEITDASLPYSNLPTLRLDPNLEQQKEHYRRRVRDARIRAKLAKYRAERLAQRYEDRFGIYPEEDEEECQTEAEQTEDE